MNIHDRRDSSGENSLYIMGFIRNPSFAKKTGFCSYIDEKAGFSTKDLQ